MGFIVLVVLFFLIITGTVVFAANKLTLLSAYVYLIAVTVYSLFFFIVIRIVRKKTLTSSIYELTREEISRTDIKTGKKIKFRYEDIDSVKFNTTGTEKSEREIIIIRFKNSRVNLTIRNDPDDVKAMLCFSRFKMLLLDYIKSYKPDADKPVRPASAFNNVFFWILLVLFFVLANSAMLFFMSGRGFKAFGLMPLFIGLIPVFVIGIMGFIKNKNR